MGQHRNLAVFADRLGHFEEDEQVNRVGDHLDLAESRERGDDHA